MGKDVSFGKISSLFSYFNTYLTIEAPFFARLSCLGMYSTAKLLLLGIKLIFPVLAIICVKSSSVVKFTSLKFGTSGLLFTTKHFAVVTVVPIKVPL
ncbi:hypothetical protein D3C71_1730310 [compost metagenome]